MAEINFHQIATELLKKDVEVVTLQGKFSGRLLEVGKDVLVLESRGRVRPFFIAVRIETIVVIHRVEQLHRGPFGFDLEKIDHVDDHHESSN
ncbi:MAG: DUF2642 domain-containing protein [Bacillus sp. (in: Bacteria)]|nr:DUF2642 domain-containing protein [Bacillus sp. (in: firmicutes)]